MSQYPKSFHTKSAHRSALSGPLDRLNAILSLLQPLDRPSVMESAIRRPYLALSRIHAQAGALNRLILNRLGGAQPRDSGAIIIIVFEIALKQARNKKRDRDCDWTLNRRGPLSNCSKQRSQNCTCNGSSSILCCLVCFHLFCSLAKKDDKWAWWAKHKTCTPPVFKLLHPYSKLLELIRIRHYSTVALQLFVWVSSNYVIPNIPVAFQ